MPPHVHQPSRSVNSNITMPVVIYCQLAYNFKKVEVFRGLSGDLGSWRPSISAPKWRQLVLRKRAGGGSHRNRPAGPARSETDPSSRRKEAGKAASLIFGPRRYAVGRVGRAWDGFSTPARAVTSRFHCNSVTNHTGSSPVGARTADGWSIYLFISRRRLATITRNPTPAINIIHPDGSGTNLIRRIPIAPV